MVASMAAGCLSFRAGGIALRLLILLRGERTARPPSLASARALVRQLCAVRPAHALTLTPILTGTLALAPTLTTHHSPSPSP